MVQLESRFPGDLPEARITTAKLGVIEIRGHEIGRFYASLTDCLVRGVRYKGGILLMRRPEDAEHNPGEWYVDHESFDRVDWLTAWATSKQRDALKEMVFPVLVEFAGSPEGKKFLREAERSRLVRTINEQQNKIAALEGKLADERAVLHHAEEKLLAL